MTTTTSLTPAQPGATSTTPNASAAPAGSGKATPQKVTLPISLHPDGPEFDAREFAGGDPAPSTWFWTKGKFHGPYLIVPNDRDVQITLQLESGQFPPSVNPTLTVSQGATQIYQTQLKGKDLNTQDSIGPIRIPALASKGQLDLTWEVTTWKPSEAGTNPKDKRELGLNIKSFDVSEAPK